MDTFETARTVLAVRRYRDEKVPDEAITRILEAARLTGSAVNEQPWHFVVVRNPDRLAEIAALLRSGSYVAGAPAAIVVAVDKTRWSLADGARAIQTMVMVAWEQGIGSNWVGFSGMLEGLKPMLGIPRKLDVVAVLPLGYPVDRLGRGHKSRKPLAEVAHLERFGNPYP